MKKYLSAQDVSTMLCCNPSTVYRMAEREGWIAREFSQGGRKERRFAVLDLPTNIRQRMLPALAETEPKGPLSVTGERESSANSRMAVVQLWRDARTNNALSLREFVSRWPDLAPESLQAKIPTVSVASLCRWSRILDISGPGALVRRIRRDKGITRLPERWHNLVLAAYLDQNRRPMRAIYTHIIHKIALEELGSDAGMRALAQKKLELKKQISEKVLRSFIQNHTTTGMVSAARGLKESVIKCAPIYPAPEPN